MARVDDFQEGAGRLYGSGDIDKVFPGGGEIASTPWKMASKSKTHQDYDPAVVQEALRKQPPTLTDIDTRDLKSTQPMVTRQGVEYYQGDKYALTGDTYADKSNVGNRFPVAYKRPTMADPTQTETVLLSGHHRATAALLNGKPIKGILLEGGRPPRRTN